MRLAIGLGGAGLAVAMVCGVAIVEAQKPGACKDVPIRWFIFPVATLADGTELSIDLVDAVTLGDVIKQINAANPAKLSAAISDDGRRLELTDLTAGGGGFSVANGAASSAAEDLGLVASAA